MKKSNFNQINLEESKGRSGNNRFIPCNVFQLFDIFTTLVYESIVALVS